MSTHISMSGFHGGRAVLVRVRVDWLWPLTCGTKVAADLCFLS